MKISTKLFICILVVLFLFIIGCEVAYNNLIHKDMSEIYNKLMLTEEKLTRYEDRFNKLWELHLKVVNKGN